MAHPHRIRIPAICVAAIALHAMISSHSGAAPGPVLINEVVTDPQFDWNDTDGGNAVAFDDLPGTGSITESDEWVELLNVSAAAVDLTSWSLEMIDITPETEVIGPGQADLVFSPGSSLAALLPGGRVVVGNPLGAMNNSSLLVLRDRFGVVSDRVEFGIGDYAGDGLLNNAPSGNAHGDWDEAVARFPDGQDTGDPAADFVKRRASIGAPNPGDAVATATILINEIVTDPQQDWNDSDGGDGLAFNDIPGTGSITDTDEWIELVNVSSHDGSLIGWTIVMIDTTPATETLGIHGAQFFFEFGGSLDRVFPDEHVVVGNPSGSMNNDVWIRLLDERGRIVDEVELGNADFRGNGLGDEAPDGNATSVDDESIARLLDGWDTGNDAADFMQGKATIAAPNLRTRVIHWGLYR